MSSITQIIVTCAFSVLACVLRCTVRIHGYREGCELVFFFLSAIWCHSGEFIFGVLIASGPSV